MSKTQISQKDMETAIGMFVAHEYYLDARKRGKTVMDSIEEIVEWSGMDNFDSKETLSRQATTAVRGLREAIAISDAEPSLPKIAPEKRNYAIKQTIVMSILGMVAMASAGQSVSDVISSEDVEDFQPSEKTLRKITAGIDPHLIRTVADVIVSDSFPTENPTDDVLETLWLEGFYVGVTGEIFYNEIKDTPTINQFVDGVKEIFDVV